MVEEMVVYPASRCASFGVFAVGIVGYHSQGWKFSRWSCITWCEVLKGKQIGGNLTHTELDIYGLHKMMEMCGFCIKRLSKTKWQYIQYIQGLWTNYSSPMHIWSCSSIKLLSCRAYSTSPPGSSTCVRMLCAATRHNVLLVGMRFSSEGHDFCYTPVFCLGVCLLNRIEYIYIYTGYIHTYL